MRRCRPVDDTRHRGLRKPQMRGEFFQTHGSEGQGFIRMLTFYGHDLACVPQFFRTPNQRAAEKRLFLKTVDGASGLTGAEINLRQHMFNLGIGHEAAPDKSCAIVLDHHRHWGLI